MNVLEQRREDALVAAKRIITNAKTAGRSLTDSERQTVQSKMDEAEALLPQIKQAREDHELREKLSAAFRGDAPANGAGRFSAKSAAEPLARQMNPAGLKALAPSGIEIAPAGLTERRPVELGRVGTSLLDAIPVQVLRDPPTFSYLKQTTRTNNAAPVADGATKPTSIYGVQRVEDRLRVIAHLSEPVPKFWLEDSNDLRSFLESELAYGLDLAVERQVLAGDGAGENLRGLLNTSGIQLQSWSVDGYETIRRALTKLQVAGTTEPVVALSPLDFEAMNLVRSTTGEFIATDAAFTSGTGGGASVPIGPPLPVAWGARVVLSTALTAGQGLVFDSSAVQLYTDGKVGVEWDSSTGFDRNEVHARFEGRFGLAVKRPLSVVSVDMSAA